MTYGGGIIRLHRQQVPWRDKFRKYRVRIDGEYVGRIAQGETQEFSVRPGEHRVRLTIDRYFTSRERVVRLRDGELAEFICGSGGSSIQSLFALLWPRRYISLDGPVQWPSRSPF